MTMTKTTAKKLAAAAAMCLTVGVVLAAGTGKFAKKPRIQGVQIGQAYAAVNGTRSFTEAVAVVQNDVLVGAYLDDFQFNDAKPEVVGVPNSDAAFGADYAEGQVLMSKRENTGFYSQLMTDYAGSTVSIDANFDAIQEFAVGKTIAELKAVAAKGAEAVDAVSGATLADTAGYLSALVQAAEAAQSNAVAPFEGDVRQLELKVVYSAANGDNCFTSGAAVTCGDTIVASYVDEFQFMDASPEIIGVPNSDADLSAGYASGKVLASKRVNTKPYSQMMADYAGSTVTIDANYNSIQEHLAGRGPEPGCCRSGRCVRRYPSEHCKLCGRYRGRCTEVNVPTFCRFRCFYGPEAAFFCQKRKKSRSACVSLCKPGTKRYTENNYACVR